MCVLACMCTCTLEYACVAIHPCVCVCLCIHMHICISVYVFCCRIFGVCRVILAGFLKEWEWYFKWFDAEITAAFTDVHMYSRMIIHGYRSCAALDSLILTCFASSYISCCGVQRNWRPWLFEESQELSPFWNDDNENDVCDNSNNNDVHGDNKESVFDDNNNYDDHGEDHDDDNNIFDDDGVHTSAPNLNYLFNEWCCWPFQLIQLPQS